MKPGVQTSTNLIATSSVGGRNLIGPPGSIKVVTSQSTKAAKTPLITT